MKYTITEHNGIYSINQTEINETIFNQELFNYSIVDRDDFIDDLIRWINEADRDRELMKDDLKYLMGCDDIYLFSSIETNEYVLESDNEEEFNSLCEELLELNKTLDNPLICPNCQENMYLSHNNVKFDDEIYNQWSCEGCSHIIVLDYIGEDDNLICNDCKNTTTDKDKLGCVCNKCKRGVFKEVEE